MRVFLTGGTGLIGRGIVRRLLERGDEPIVLSRRADAVRREPAMRPVRVIQGDPSSRGNWEEALDGCDAVINLVGYNLFAKRWSAKVKRTIRDSRVYSTENVVRAIQRAHNPPKVLVQASAIGYYGPHGDEELTEECPSGSDFMAVVCREWEEAAAPAAALGVRLATIRTGVVLAKGEGALGAMTPLYQLFFGAAPVGNGGKGFSPASGDQWMSWIHIDDIVGVYLLALDNADAHGPINGTSPNPVRHHDFGKALARVLWRPFLPFGPPDAMLELMLGEVADVVTKGQRVLPKKAQALGYRFQYAEILAALQAVFAKPPAPPRAHTPTAAAAGHGHGHH